MSNNKFSGKLGAKGYYIALILCAVAIGISGYVFYRNSQQQELPQNEPAQSLEIPQEDVEAVATQPVTGSTQKPTETTTPPTQSIPGKVLSPVSGNTAAKYAMDALSYNPTTRDWRTHNGLDIAAAEGTAVCAAANGVVKSVSEDESMGTTVVITHAEGYCTTYASLDKDVSVVAGQVVEAGQQIGVVGCTALMETALGEHVHFAVTCNGNPVNPEDFLALEQL